MLRETYSKERPGAAFEALTLGRSVRSVIYKEMSTNGPLALAHNAAEEPIRCHLVMTDLGNVPLLSAPKSGRQVLFWNRQQVRESSP